MFRAPRVRLQNIKPLIVSTWIHHFLFIFQKMIKRIFSFAKWYRSHSKMNYGLCNNFCQNLFAILLSIRNLCLIRCSLCIGMKVRARMFETRPQHPSYIGSMLKTSKIHVLRTTTTLFIACFSPTIYDFRT